jgi:hypothetical protein
MSLRFLSKPSECNSQSLVRVTEIFLLMTGALKKPNKSETKDSVPKGRLQAERPTRRATKEIVASGECMRPRRTASDLSQLPLCTMIPGGSSANQELPDVLMRLLPAGLARGEKDLSLGVSH